MSVARSLPISAHRGTVPPAVADVEPLLVGGGALRENVILEVMTAALPVAAYGGRGDAELVNRQRAALVEPGDEPGFVNAELVNAVAQILAGAQSTTTRAECSQIPRRKSLESVQNR